MRRPVLGACLGIGALAASGCAAREHIALPAAGALPAVRQLDLPAVELSARSRATDPRLGNPVVDLSDGVGPQEAAALALTDNPDILAARLTRDKLVASLVGARLISNPAVAGGPSFPHGQGSAGTVPAWSGALEWTIRPGMRRARVREARAELDATDLSIAWSEWQLIQATREAIIRWWAARRALELIDDELAFQAETLDRLQHEVDTGDATLPDMGVHVVAQHGTRTLRADIDRQRIEARDSALYLAGLPAHADLQPASLGDAALSWPPLPDEADAVRTALDSRVDLSGLRRGFDAEDARLRQALLSRIPAITVGLTADRNESALSFLGGTVALDLPLFDHAQAQVSREQATKARLRAEFLARVENLRHDVNRLQSIDAQLGRALIDAQQDLDQLARLEDAERAAVQAGDLARLTWQEVRASLLDVRLQIVSLTSERLTTRVAIETILGAPAGTLVPPSTTR